MPEGPEVSWMVNKISKKFKNSQLKGVAILGGRYKRHGNPKGYSTFLGKLPSKITDFCSKGKFIYILLNGGLSIWITLGLSGDLVTQNHKHNNVEFMTNKGSFFLNDQRNFGTVYFSIDPKELQTKLDSLGIDPLKTRLTKSVYDKYMSELMKKKSVQNKDVGLLLIDQKYFAGIGNYLRAEILYAAQISPFRKMNSLTNVELDKLRISIDSIMNNSYNTQIKHGLHTYPFKVYKRKKTPNGEKVESKKYNGRTIWWIPTVQK